MRSIYLLPLTALVAIAAGCRTEVKESGAVPPRDLTLVTQTPEVTTASPVETERPRIARRAVRAPRAPVTVHLAGLGAAAAAVPAPEPAAQPAAEVPIPTNDRELLPGTTVTLIPASTGPSAGPDDPAELPAVHGRTVVTRGGGKCRGGGRGPGIARAPRPDFRAGS